MKLYRLIIATVLLTLGMAAPAAEHSIGKPIVKNHLILAAVYLQPVHMTPPLPGMDGTFDIHLEADIHADKNNPHGFGGGAWVPYLTVNYELTKAGSDWSDYGQLVPMVANDGPHYGANIKLDGPGKYQVAYRVLPPPYAGFLRHTDKETGVAEWWQPMQLEWDFTYAGAGKKGGY